MRVIFPAIVLLNLQLIHLDLIDGPHIDRTDVMLFPIAEDPDHNTDAAGVTERM
jgi:hypothetical protein